MKKIETFIREIINKVNESHVMAYSASGAFFLLMSTIPFLMLLLSIIQYMPISEDNLIELILTIVPSKYEVAVVDFIQEINKISIIAVPITAVTTLWTATKGVSSISRGLNVIHEVKETRNYVVVKINGMFDTLLMICGLVLSLVLLVFGENLLNWIDDKIVVLGVVIDFLLSFRHALAFGILLLFFGLIYSLLPNKTLSFIKELPGAAISSLGWIVFSYIFAIFIDRGNKYSLVYGSMAGIILIMVWLYICMLIFFVGAVVNSTLWKDLNKSEMMKIYTKKK